MPPPMTIRMACPTTTWRSIARTKKTATTARRRARSPRAPRGPSGVPRHLLADSFTACGRAGRRARRSGRDPATAARRAARGRECWRRRAREARRTHPRLLQPAARTEVPLDPLAHHRLGRRPHVELGVEPSRHAFHHHHGLLQKHQLGPRLHVEDLGHLEEQRRAASPWRSRWRGGRGSARRWRGAPARNPPPSGRAAR